MDCLPRQIDVDLIDSVLQNTGASRAVRQQVVQQLEETKHVDGFVVLVNTNKNLKSITVGNPVMGVPLVSFRFPANPPSFESELIRAQDQSRTVTVTYTTDAKSTNTILSVLVYAMPPAKTG